MRIDVEEAYDLTAALADEPRATTRRSRVVVLAAVVAVVAAAGLLGARTSAPAPAADAPRGRAVPAVVGSAYSTRAFDVPLTLTLPYWVGHVRGLADLRGHVRWVPATCPPAAVAPCPWPDDHPLTLLHPSARFLPSDTGPLGPVPVPTYTGYVTLVERLGDQRAVTVVGEHAQTVDGHQATVFTLSPRVGVVSGELGCDGVGSPADSFCLDLGGPDPTELTRLAVVDLGAGGPPLLVWTSAHADDSDLDMAEQAFDDMLGTVDFRCTVGLRGTPACTRR